MQGIIYLLTHKEDLQKGVISINPMVMIPFIEIADTFTVLQQMASPRYIKSHLAYKPFFQRALAHSKTNIIVVFRNPKDVLVSFFHFYRMNKLYGNFPGSWNDFFELFRADSLVYGNWFDHILQWWGLRETHNILFLWFEDMKNNPVVEIKKIANFLKKDVSEEDVQKIAEMTLFGNFQDSMSVHLDHIKMFDISKARFLRKGEVGDWKNHFTVAQNEWFDQEYSKRMQGSGMTFDFGDGKVIM